MEFDFKQKEPKSEESKLELAMLRLYFFIWLAWTFIKLMTIITTFFTTIILFGFLFLGMLQLNYTYLALFAFLNILPIFGTTTTFLDRMFNKKNPFEGSIAINIILLVDLLVSFYGIRVAYRCFRVFKAEALGFKMRGEIDGRKDLNDEESGEKKGVKPFSGKGVVIGGSG